VRSLTERILDILDEAAASFTFPSLDNGYVYLAATRLSAFHSAKDWALVLQVFGYSPREGIPSIYVTTFGSTLRKRLRRRDFASERAYKTQLAKHANDASTSFWPIKDGDWTEDCDYVSLGTKTVELRGRRVAVPTREQCRVQGVKLEEKRLQIFELCRYLAAIDRDAVLATDDEERANVPAALARILRLDEWHHPDITADERPSKTQTFQQIADVLATGDVTRYRTRERPNTHWRHWPDGGSL
jgi:hypothetical protein